MPRLNLLRQCLLALIMLLAAVLAYAFTPRTFTADSNHIDLAGMVPTAFADWRQVEMKGVIVNPEVDAQLNRTYSQVLERVYVNGRGQHVMLSIAYSRDQRQGSGQQTHRPELCYPAQGFALHDKQPDTLQLGGQRLAVTTMVAQREQRTEPLMYWITTNGEVASDRESRKLVQVRAGLAGLVYDGMIVRVSTINDDVAAARALETEFLASLYAAQAEGVRTQFFGMGVAAL